MAKVDCAYYVWYNGDKILTDRFCEQCPEYDRCSGFLEEIEMKRLLLEDGWKLQPIS
jgi:hypothetical protein